VESVLQSAATVFRDAVARVGFLALFCACLVPLLGASFPSDVRSTSVAAAFATTAIEPPGRAPERVRDVARADLVLGVRSAPVPTAEPAPVPRPEPTLHPTPPRTLAPAVALPQLPDPLTAGIVIASWYGPGFYGNRTACGQTYTPEIIGVAYRTLPCGTLVVLEYRGRTMTVPVIDRGPYVAGRTLDLSVATRLAIGCPDLCTLSMRIGP
jgi:rare lipoprotein A (peptidoglycan hydrolase)